MREKRTASRCAIFSMLFLISTGCQTALRISTTGSNDMLSFENFDKAASVVSMLEVSGLSEKQKIAGMGRFRSMLDLFLDINSRTDEDGVNAYLDRYSGMLSSYTRQDPDGNANTYYCLKISPVYAAIVNPSGDVKIAGKVYSLLDEGDAAAFSANLRKALADQVKSAPERPVRFIPMWTGLTLGDKYSTTDFRMTIDGRDTVVQLWKGFYPAAMGVGGVGAEIGLYHASSSSASIWFPDYLHPRPLSYSLVYKKTGMTLFSASGTTWWLNAWKLGPSSPSLKGSDYTLYYSIDGIEGAW